MAQVPNVGSVGYSPVNENLPGVQANPGAFGASVGQALRGFGAQLQQTTDQIGDRLQEIAANDAVNKFMDTAHSVTSGDPNNPNDAGYFGLKGQDAINGRQSAAQKLSDTYTSLKNSLPPMAQNQFENDARRYYFNTQGAIDEHYKQQVQVAAVNSADTSLQLATQGAYNNRYNPDGFQTNLQAIQDAARKKVAAIGGTTADTSALFQKMKGEAIAGAIRGYIADGKLTMAQGALQAHSSDLSPEAYDALTNQLQPKIRNLQASQASGAALAQADDDYRQATLSQPQTGVRPTLQAVTQSLAAQESSGNPNAPTSITGASGKYQIEPGTFAQYAQPGEAYASERDREAVSERAISQLYQKYNGDPSRVAVAWFSGPGNVAPIGSATPWIADKADPTGKTTSSYVSDFLPRVGVVQSKADFLKAHFQQYVDASRAQATALHPEDPQFGDVAAARTEQQLGAVIRQQDLAYGADKDLILQAANGSLSRGQAPMTVDQLTSVRPDVAAAWERMQMQQPEVAHEITTRLLTENARSNGSDGRDYGQGFINVFQRIHAADGDPNRITDPAQLISMVGQPGGLTMAGLTRAREELAGKNTPDSEAESQMRNQLFKVARAQISGADDQLGMKDPKGDQLYLNWMAQAFSQIKALKAQGKTPAQIYSPDSPDYVGKNITAFKRPLQQWTADMMAPNGAGGPAPGTTASGQAPDLSTPAAVRNAYRAGQIDRATATSALMKMPMVPAVPTAY